MVRTSMNFHCSHTPDLGIGNFCLEGCMFQRRVAGILANATTSSPEASAHLVKDIEAAISLRG